MLGYHHRRPQEVLCSFPMCLGMCFARQSRKVSWIHQKEDSFAWWLLQDVSEGHSQNSASASWSSAGGIAGCHGHHHGIAQECYCPEYHERRIWRSEHARVHRRNGLKYLLVHNKWLFTSLVHFKQFSAINKYDLFHLKSYPLDLPILHKCTR